MIDLTIREPGVYDIPNAAYHAQICDGVSTSRSQLWTLRSKSPAHMWASFSANPEAIKEERTRALDFGNAAHSLLLEGVLPKDEYVISPFKKNWACGEEGITRKEKQAWKADKEAHGLIIITQNDLDTIEAMRDALFAHHLIKDGLFHGKIEQSVFWKRKAFWLKARPDVIPHDEIYPDYKSVADASRRAVESSITKFGYHLQLAMIVDGLHKTQGLEIKNACIVCQEKTPPYIVAVYPLTEYFIHAGRVEYQAAHDRFIECWKRREWPSYDDQDITTPGWLQDKLQLEGLL